MGQAKLRGTYEMRQQEGIVKRIAEEKAYQERQKEKMQYFKDKFKGDTKAYQQWLMMVGIIETFRQ